MGFLSAERNGIRRVRRVTDNISIVVHDNRLECIILKDPFESIVMSGIHLVESCVHLMKPKTFSGRLRWRDQRSREGDRSIVVSLQDISSRNTSRCVRVPRYCLRGRQTPVIQTGTYKILVVMRHFGVPRTWVDIVADEFIAHDVRTSCSMSWWTAGGSDDHHASV